MAKQKRSAKLPAKRRYTLGQRRASMEETRARILDAAVELYETVGPGAASMSAVAARAGITRTTLYRHFRSDDDVANAVLDEWRNGSPIVDLAALAAIADPADRLRAALRGLYVGYRATAAMTAQLIRHSERLPAERRDEVRAAASATRDAVATAGPSGPDAPTARALMGHAVAFETWHSLSTEGLTDEAIADLMVRLLVPRPEKSGKAKAAKAKGGRKVKADAKAERKAKGRATGDA